MDATDTLRLAADVADPRAGLRATASLRRLADTLEFRQVEAALAAGLGWQDIADALGISRGTVKSQASDAMRTLRTLLPDGPEGMPSADTTPDQPLLRVVGEGRER